MRKTFNQLSQSSVYKQDDISVCLSVCGGTYGGGSEVLVVIDGESIKENPTTSNALCTPAMSDPPVVAFTERAGKPGGGKGMLCRDIPGAIATEVQWRIAYAVSDVGRHEPSSRCNKNL